MAMISNLPTSILAVSIIFENESKFTDVTPAVKPVVVIAETDSNRASSKLLLVSELKTDPVIKAMETYSTITTRISLTTFLLMIK